MPRGGARQGAGRPKGQGKYLEPTKPIRVPESMIKEVLAFVENKGNKLPLYSSSVQAGFPSPADDYVEGKLDLNEYLVKNPVATFFVRVSGESMINAGIYPDDILVVDKSITPINNKIVIAALDGYLTVKRLIINKKGNFLMPENDKFSPIEISNNMDMIIWGVVTSVLHKV